MTGKTLSILTGDKMELRDFDKERKKYPSILSMILWITVIPAVLILSGVGLNLSLPLIMGIATITWNAIYINYQIKKVYEYNVILIHEILEHNRKVRNAQWGAPNVDY
jgi:hypothetical protein